MLYAFVFCWFFVFKQKTAYEMRISDWSSDVCSSDLLWRAAARPARGQRAVHLSAVLFRERRARRRTGRARAARRPDDDDRVRAVDPDRPARWPCIGPDRGAQAVPDADRKSTRLNSSH